jgi:RNA polymerase sigma factor (sigma-70 family)
VADDLEIELVASAISGDLESFGRLAGRYYSAVKAIAYSVLYDHQLAEDAAQETFARAIVSLDNLKDAGKFGSWLAAICRNVAKDMLADKTRQINCQEQAAQTNNPDECNTMIRRVIEKLPAGEKELIVLRYYDGLSYEQIGSVLGLGKAAINGRLTRAKRKMKKHLLRNGFPENQL